MNFLYNLLDSLFSLISTLPPEYEKYLIYIPFFVIALILSFLLVPIIGYFGERNSILDLPKEERNRKNYLNKFDNAGRHIHKNPTPLLGGLAPLLPVLLYLTLSPKSSITIPLVMSLSILIIVGFLDDKYNLSPKIQLSAQLIAALIIVFSKIDLAFINNPLTGGIINLNWTSLSISNGLFPISLTFPGDTILVGWIILCTNAMKWVGGTDGLLDGISFIAYLFLFLIGIRTGSFDVTVISIIMAGGILGLLIYNYHPAFIFDGAIGKTTFGFLIATLAIINGAKLATTMIILTIPVIDAFVVLVNRYKAHKPRNFLELMKINDTTHLHHNLLNMGLSHTQVFLVEVSIQLVVSAIGVLTAGAVKLFFMLIFAALVTTSLFLVKKFGDEINRKKPPETPESKYSY